MSITITEKPVICLLSRQELRDFRELAFEYISQLKDKAILTIMGMLNAYGWRAAVNWGAIEGKGRWELNHQGFKELLNVAADGELFIEVANTWLEGYLKDHYPGAYHGIPYLIQRRKDLITLGIIYFDVENRPKGARWGAAHDVPAQGVATPPIMEVNLPKMLIFYQMCDRILRQRLDDKYIGTDKSSFDFMPSHGGSVMKQLYEAMFPHEDFAGNVVLEATDIEVERVHVPLIPKLIKWRWKKLFHTTQSVWQDMVKRTNQLVRKTLILPDVSELVPT